MTIYRQGLLAAAGAVAGAALALAGCSAGPAPASRGAHQAGPGHTAAFGWFRPGPAPSGWRHATLPGNGAVLAFPPALHPMRGDKGTITEGLTSPAGAVLVYLNATPRQGDETVRDWPSFRVGHLRDEGQRAVHLDAASPVLAFRGGHGRCLIDSYTSTVGTHHYREIACYVRGSHAASVLIVATPQRRWRAYAGVLEQAVSSYMAS
jgi:hypothetical protein